jgi:thiamine pyrophosphokinase
MNKINKPLVIVANGEFPKNSIPLEVLSNAKYIIACDGAIDKLVKNGCNPNLIIGDLDSISAKSMKKYKDIIFEISNQSENDLRKAINYAKENNINEISIVGSTGDREDHLIGNIFSLFNYPNIKIIIFTDTGTFELINKSQKIKSFNGQKISIFTLDNTIIIESKHLKYNFNKTNISNLFSATLNESIYHYFILNISHGNLLIYKSYN